MPTIKNSRPKPMLLMILDGFGHSENPKHNAVLAAKMPFWNKLWQQYPHQLIQASGQQVGLPDGQMGNSEVGHLNLGAGRVVYQELTRIGQAIKEGSFDENEALCHAMDQAISQGKAVHIMGLLSAGGVHSHEDHIQAALDLAFKRKAEKVFLHAFLDGRDTPPQSAAASIAKFEAYFKQKGKGRLASIIGRYYAMDRDNRWERVEKCYRLLTECQADYIHTSATEALAASYGRGEYDEFVAPILITGEGQPSSKIESGDAIIFMNFRADRARELSHVFCDEQFAHFKRSHQLACPFVTLTHYATDIDAAVAFKADTLENVLGQYVANLGLTQLRIAETEKYAHVTFFFNGGREKPFEGESRCLIPSPKVATYDLQPEMNAPLLTQKLVDAIKQQQFDLIICNFANPDMVGHTGNFSAAVQALEAIDICLEKIIKAQLACGGETLITADHGNVEQMFDDETQQPHTAHTSEPVPIVYIGRPATAVVTNGALSDVAPTLLALMGLDKPKEMTGHALFSLVPHH